MLVKTKSFPLSTFNCSYSWARIDVDYDERGDDFIEIYYNSDSDSSDSDGEISDDNRQTNCLVFSVCYTELRPNLIFDRFCFHCQNTFLIYFTREFAFYFKLYLLVKKMPNALRACDCFFDVVVFCQRNDSIYGNFFRLCIEEKNKKKISFMNINSNEYIIAWCMDFLKTVIEISRFEKLREQLMLSCWFSFFDDADACLNTEQNINCFCYMRQKIILINFSAKLHYIPYF